LGTRVKTFDSTGLAPNGRLYAGDLNAMQDMPADLYNLLQNVGVGTLVIGEASLQLVRYGAGEARLSGMLRTDGILRGLGGVYAGAYTTTQRDAIAAGIRPYGLIILNTTNNRIEWNSGTDAVPNWQPIAPVLTTGTITNNLIADSAVDARTILDGSVATAEISGTLKPSVSAGAATEALRALGTGAGNAAAGNDIRLTGISVINTQGGNYTLALSDAGGLVRMNVGGANTCTVPANASVPFPVQTIVNVSQWGGGQTTIAAAGGVALRVIPGLKMIGQFAVASLVKVATDEWLVSGNLTA